MVQIGHLDSLERQRDKQRSRDEDDHDLRAGLVSSAELSARNGFFSGLEVRKARIRQRWRIAA